MVLVFADIEVRSKRDGNLSDRVSGSVHLLKDMAVFQQHYYHLVRFGKLKKALGHPTRTEIDPSME
jgi:hypothetical protein